MPSGKKARGRQNRAKKEANRTAGLRILWEPTVLRDSGVSNTAASSCEHMLAVLPRIPQQGPAVSFMNHIAGEGFFDKAMSFTDVQVEIFFLSAARHFPVAEEASERSLAINLLLRFIRNVFLHDSVAEGEKWFHGRPGNEVMICTMINMLENYGTYSDQFVVGRRADKTSNRLSGGNRRDVVKFVAKRLPCTCLKKLHSATRKKVAKLGMCHGCRKQFPISQLYVCTGCRCNEYCSRECQRAVWSHHKKYCGHPELMSQDLPTDYVFERDLQGN